MINRFVAIGASVMTVALLAVGSAALAVDVVVPGTSGGGAVWKVGEYGVEQSLDAEALYAETYYPNLIYGDIYFACGTNGGTDVTVTNEANGDITVDCPTMADLVPGLTYTMHFRMYAEATTGYLERQWLDVTNTSDAPIDIDTLYFAFFYNRDGWNGVPALASNGSNGLADGDVWLVAGNDSGGAIVTASAWAAKCGSAGWTLDGMSNTMSPPPSEQVIPAHSSLGYVTFMNMVFPTTADAAGASAAFDLATRVAENEFDSGLTGRLVEGIPAGTHIVGWTVGACPPIPSPELPNTGVDVGSLGPTGFGALVVMAAGCAAIVVRRRTRA